ncbi:hypothetical protein D1872_306690 [compost metagenome]
MAVIQPNPVVHIAHRNARTRAASRHGISLCQRTQLLLAHADAIVRNSIHQAIRFPIYAYFNMPFVHVVFDAVHDRIFDERLQQQLQCQAVQRIVVRV